MPRSYYYFQQTPLFVAPQTASVPTTGDGLVIPLLAKSNSTGRILTGNDNVFITRLEGSLIFSHQGSATFEVIHRFWHYVGDVSGDPSQNFSVDRSLLAFSTGRVSVPLVGFNSEAIVPPSYDGGVIPIQSDLIVRAFGLFNPNVRTAVDLTSVSFVRARATFRQDFPRDDAADVVVPAQSAVDAAPTYNKTPGDNSELSMLFDFSAEAARSGDSISMGSAFVSAIDGGKTTGLSLRVVESAIVENTNTLRVKVAGGIAGRTYLVRVAVNTGASSTVDRAAIIKVSNTP